MALPTAGGLDAPRTSGHAPRVSDPSDLLRLARAFDAAARAHGAQRRKITGEPYLAHLAEVAAWVAEAGAAEGWGSADAIVAALLHDAVEDTDTTLGMIAAEFGAPVAEIVRPLTDEPGWDALGIAGHKALQAEAMAAAPEDARRVKIADQTSNCLHRATTVAQRRPDEVAAYLAGARTVVEPCRGASPALEARFDIAAGALERALATVYAMGEEDA